MADAAHAVDGQMNPLAAQFGQQLWPAQYGHFQNTRSGWQLLVNNAGPMQPAGGAHQLDQRFAVSAAAVKNQRLMGRNINR